jgi:hypothetical protein
MTSGIRFSDVISLPCHQFWMKTMLLLYRYFTKKRTYRYIDVLQKFASTYNATPHRSLNYIAPQDVNDDNQSELWAYMYLNRNFIGLIVLLKMSWNASRTIFEVLFFSGLTCKCLLKRSMTISKNCIPSFCWLNDVYYKLGQAGAYTGPAKIHKILQQRGIKSPGL